MKHIVGLFIFLSSINVALAQQPLSKKDQLRKAEFLAQIEAEKNYEETKNEADEAFLDRDYVKSRMLYNEAIQFSKENEQWLISMVNDLDILMAEIIAREVDTIEVITKKAAAGIAKPEVVVSEINSRNEEMIVSLPVVEEILEVEEPKMAQPTEQSKPQIDPEPEVVIKEQPKPVTPIVKPVTKPVELVKEDYSKYPQGRSDETFPFPDHIVRRVIVRDGIDTIVYKYVTHRWGGNFYFKDYVSIVERIWKEEVEAFEVKYPSNSANQ